MMNTTKELSYNTSVGEGGPSELTKKGIHLNKKNNEYYVKTRENCFIKCCERIIKYNIKSGLDLACSNGHSVFIANKKGIDFKGCDIEFDEKYNKIFIDNFNQSKLFKLEFNELINHNVNYDIITSFNITHIFDDVSMEYLINVISNKSKYCYLHINHKIIDHIKNIFKNYTDFILIFKDEVNAGHGVNTWYYIFIKFKTKIIIPKYKKFFRNKQTITLI